MATKNTPAVQTPPVDKPLVLFADATNLGGAGRGNENVSTNDLLLPRLEIVQAQSPIKDENPDAREGLMFNSASQEVLGDTVYLIPISFRVEYNLWKDQDEGGGFFGSFPTEQEANQKREQVASEGENIDFLEVVDTPVHYCMKVMPDGTHEQLVVAMSKSKAKVSRRWNTLIAMGGGDRFSRVYRMTTFKDKNKKNQSFHNYVVSPAGFAPKALFEVAEKMYQVFKTQNVRTDYTDMPAADVGQTEI